MRFAFVFILLVLVLGVGGIWLQIFLSRKESKWAGLILPIISFGVSLVALLGVLLFYAFEGTMTTVVDGEIVEQTTTQIASAAPIIWSAIYAFALCNIPTVILIAIYATYRGKRNRQRAIEKMSVQDLG